MPPRRPFRPSWPSGSPPLNMPPPAYAYPADMAQSAVPSQQDVPGFARPFDPSGQPDMQQSFLATKSETTPFFDVRASHDSRPLFAYDYYWEDQFADGIRQTPIQVVPQGWTFLLRGLAIEIFPNTSVASTGVMSVWGDMFNTGVGVTTPKLQILVNGSPTQLWTQYGPSGLNGVPLFNVLITGVILETFVVIPALANFTIFIPNFIDNVSGLTNFDTHCIYYGQMLLASGREPSQDVGNGEPQAVSIVGGDVGVRGQAGGAT